MEKTKNIRRGKRILIGFAFMIFISLVFGAFPFLLASIVCTGGISLIVYIPLALMLGTAIDKLIFNRNNKIEEQISANTDKNNVGSDNQILLTKDQIALVNYIREAQSRGMDTNSIFLALKDNGWMEDDIRKAFGYSQTHTKI